MGDLGDAFVNPFDWSGVYRGRHVLVTGHTGFKGGWLSLWLAALGARVTGFSLPAPTTPSLFEAARLGDRVDHVEGDVRDRDALGRTVARVTPDLVFHLAAQPIVRASYGDPIATFATNVMGTANVLDAVRVAGREVAVIVITSDKCYENREWPHAYRETDRLGGRDPYSASKAAAEIVVSSFRQSFFPPERMAAHGVAVATTRAGNVIGGGDWASDRIVPDCLRALRGGESIAVRRPGAVRPWQHVLEPLAGYLMLGARLASADPAERARFADAWNFAPDVGDSRTVRELVCEIVAAYGGGAWHEASDGGPHEAGMLRLANDKARALLGWKPLWGFPRAVAATVDWYRAFDGGGSAADLCDRQIAEYLEMATV